VLVELWGGLLHIRVKRCVMSLVRSHEIPISRPLDGYHLPRKDRCIPIAYYQFPLTEIWHYLRDLSASAVVSVVLDNAISVVPSVTHRKILDFTANILLCGVIMSRFCG
jgi:hypothetical protein